MSALDCPNCGGTHIGSNKCPFIKTPCMVCGDATILACSDCAINSGGKTGVHVCEKSSCRDRHESEVHPDRDAEQLAGQVGALAGELARVG